MSDLRAPLESFAGRPVMLGLSGGADSVGMLRALLEVGAVVFAGHVNHRLRPDADADAEWVAALCEELGVPLDVQTVDVARVARDKHLNVEAAARLVRYSFLTRAARRRGAQVTLTAHTRGDQAETVMLQLLRGEHALTGIAPGSGLVERPWLDVERREIEAFLRALGQEWLEDASNRDARFSRNWLRLSVLPALRERYPALNETFARHARYQQEDEAVLMHLAEALPEHADLRREPVAVLRRWVARELRGARLTFHTEHVEVLARALREGRTRHVTLPGGTNVTVTGGRLHLAPLAWPRPDFPYPESWELRHPRPGDRVRLPHGSRKVSDVLTDRKVPRAERERVWVLAEHADVHWVGLSPAVTAVGVVAKPEPWWSEMGEALELAREAADAGEVPIGAVVVHEGRVVAGARNSSRAANDMTCHAELQALRQATRVLGTPYLTNCTLVVTLEPCPMCFGACVEARVGRIVFGARNQKQGALGTVADLGRHSWGHAPLVVRDVRARECQRMLSAFFGNLR